MRISDWSSDVCSSDLLAKPLRQLGLAEPRPPRDLRHGQGLPPAFADQLVRGGHTLGVDLAERRLAMERRRKSEEHTSELQSLMRISYAVFCLKKKKNILKRKEYNRQQKKQMYEQ